MNQSTDFKDRRLFLLTLTFVLVSVSIGASILVNGWMATWNWLLIPAMYPPFADLRTVQGGLNAVAIGLNPQIENPADPWARKMNYPMVWIWIAKVLHFDNEYSYLAFVVFAILLFLYSCYRILLISRSLWLLLILFSTASLLAIERGNNDLIVFSFLYFSIVYPGSVSILLLLAAMQLKVYPAVVVLAFLRERLHFAIIVVAGGVIIFWLSSEISLIRAATPVSIMLAYGSASIAAAVKAKIGISVAPVAVSMILLTATAAFYLKWTALLVNGEGDTEGIKKKMFLVGALVYTGTFLAGSNFDYRLIFLIMCVPYVLQLKTIVMRNGLPFVMVVAMNQLLLDNGFGSVGVLVNIFCKCLLFVVLASLLFRLLKDDAAMLFCQRA